MRPAQGIYRSIVGEIVHATGSRLTRKDLHPRGDSHAVRSSLFKLFEGFGRKYQRFKIVGWRTFKQPHFPCPQSSIWLVVPLRQVATQAPSPWIRPRFEIWEDSGHVLSSITIALIHFF